MHEGKFTQQIVDTIIQELKKYPQHHPKKVLVSVGEVFHLEPESVRMHFAYLTKGTDLEKIQLDLKEIAVEIQCSACHYEGPLDDHHMILCPKCSSPKVKVTKGKDIRLESIEVE